MQRGPLKKEHLNKLAEYGVDNMASGACAWLRYKAGETILQEGMPISYLLIVVAGKAKVCSVAKNGRNLVLCYYISEGILGDMEFMMDTCVSTTSVIAITDFECIGLPFQQCAVDLKSDPGFLNRLGHELSAKLLRSSKNYVSAALYSGEERLCAYILQTSNQGVFRDTLTDVSCSVGMSYRHLFRLLNQLCADGLLEKRNDGYLIVNRGGLIRRAAEPY